MSRKIKSVSFSGDKTIIKFQSVGSMRGYNELVEETNTKKSDMIRHKTLNQAMENMTAHLAIALGFEMPTDTTGVLYDETFFNKAEWKDKAVFKKLTLTGIILTGHDAYDGIELVGTIETPAKNLAKLVTDPIALIRTTEGYNYALLDILKTQWDILEECINDFLGGKTGATSVQASMNLDAAAPPRKPTATKASNAMAAAGIVVN